MGNDVFPHEDVFKDPFALDLFAHFPGGRTALEIVGVDDLALPDIQGGKLGNFVPDKIVEPRNAYPGLFIMFVLVIVAYLVKIVTIVKNAYTQDFQ
jgi:hypothetical protein